MSGDAVSRSRRNELRVKTFAVVAKIKSNFYADLAVLDRSLRSGNKLLRYPRIAAKNPDAMCEPAEVARRQA